MVGNAGCLAGRQYCRITPEGNVTPCPYLPLVAGNVRHQPFIDIWWTADPLRRLRDGALTGQCGVCDFRQVCGGCRARAFALTGDLLGEDPWCAYQSQQPASSTREESVAWSPEAELRLQRIPPFIRERVKVAVEKFAQANHEREVTPEVMTATLEGLGRAIPFRRPEGIRVADSASLSEEQPSRKEGS